MSSLVSGVRYERRRITTIRSTWIVLGLLAITTPVLAFLLAQLGEVDSDGNPISDSSSTLGGAMGSMLFFGAILLSVIAAQAIGQEYKFGVIRLTLTAFPRRWDLGSAKLIVTSAVIVLGAAIAGSLALVGSLVSTGNYAGWGGSQPVTVVLYLLLYALFAFAISGITRSVVLGVVIPLVTSTIVETLLLTVTRQEWLVDWMPFSAGQAGAGGDWVALGVFAAWAAALLLVWWVLFMKRDA